MSGDETATRRPTAGSFMLFKLPANQAFGRDKAQQYSDLCKARGMVGVGSGNGNGGDACDRIDAFGGMCMPDSWGYSMMDGLHAATGWTRVVFFDCCGGTGQGLPLTRGIV